MLFSDKNLDSILLTYSHIVVCRHWEQFVDGAVPASGKKFAALPVSGGVLAHHCELDWSNMMISQPGG